MLTLYHLMSTYSMISTIIMAPVVIILTFFTTYHKMISSAIIMPLETNLTYFPALSCPITMQLSEPIKCPVIINCPKFKSTKFKISTILSSLITLNSPSLQGHIHTLVSTLTSKPTLLSKYLLFIKNLHLDS